MSGEDGTPHRRVGIGALALVVLVHVVLAVAFTWPLTAELGTSMVGGPRDGPMFLWNLWWGQYALFELGHSPLWTEYLFAPQGIGLVFNTHAVAPSVLSAPLQWAFGLVTAYNLVILGTFVLSGVGAYLLTFEVVRHRGAALVASAAFAFCHHRLSSVMYMSEIQSQWLVLFTWATWLALVRHARYGTILAVVFGALLAYSSYTLFALAALIGAALLVGALASNRAHWHTTALHALGLCAALAITLVPLLLAIRAETAEHGYYMAMEGDDLYRATTPLGELLVRSPYHGANDPLPFAGYLGSVTLLFALGGLVLARRERLVWFWAALAAAFLVVSLGPQLDLTGLPLLDAGRTDVGLPFAWLDGVPLLGEIRVAHRFGVAGALALAVVAGFGARALLERVERRSNALVAAVTAALLATVVTADLAQRPFPLLFSIPEPPAELAHMADDERDCTVLQLPDGRAGYTVFSYFQTIHRTPVAGNGEVARLPESYFDLIASNHLRTLSSSAFRTGEIKERKPAQMRRKIRAQVHEQRIGWIIVSWANVRRLRHNVPAFTDGVVALDELILETLPDAEVVFAAPDGAPQRWSQRADRRAFHTIYRIYRVDFEAYEQDFQAQREIDARLESLLDGDR